MNVAVLDRDIRPIRAAADLDQAPEPVGHTREWIDPEGDDWFAVIYQELIRGTEAAASPQFTAPEPEHWFG